MTTSQRIFILLLGSLCTILGTFSLVLVAQSQQSPSSLRTKSGLASDSPLATPTAKPTSSKAVPTQVPSATATISTTQGVEEALPEPANQNVLSFEEVRQAVIRIEVKGNFYFPGQAGATNQTQGSGFIIDPTGLAVTNQHVVTGGAILNVFVGDETQARHARVVAVSECADLALIDIEGDHFPYLNWYDQPIRTGLSVFAAGFSSSDDEYTLTQGIVAKNRAKGETQRVSLNKLLQHDANLLSGMEGGPLVDEAGRVVGIHYPAQTTSARRSAKQYFDLASEEAQSVIESLRDGKNVDSIGINGAISFLQTDNTDPVPVLWVAAVASGSPAAVAKLRPGDILLTLEGIALTVDSSMKTYCDILRSHAAEDVMGLEVLRLQNDGALRLKGQLNGKALQVIEIPATATAAPTVQPTPEPTEVQKPSGKSGGRSGKIEVTEYYVYLPLISKSPPLARVVASALNLRSGPGTQYGVIGSVRFGTTLVVLGQAARCSWLNVQLSNGVIGWVAGQPQYTQVNEVCEKIPLMG